MPVAVVMLGGAHDLTGRASRFTGSNCEYLCVTMKRFTHRITMWES